MQPLHKLYRRIRAPEEVHEDAERKKEREEEDSDGWTGLQHPDAIACQIRALQLGWLNGWMEFQTAALFEQYWKRKKLVSAVCRLTSDEEQELPKVLVGDHWTEIHRDDATHDHANRHQAAAQGEEVNDTKAPIEALHKTTGRWLMWQRQQVVESLQKGLELYQNATKPGTPTGLQAVDVRQTQVLLSWTPPTIDVDSLAPLLGYRILIYPKQWESLQIPDEEYSTFQTKYTSFGGTLEKHGMKSQKLEYDTQLPGELRFGGKTARGTGKRVWSTGGQSKRYLVQTVQAHSHTSELWVTGLLPGCGYEFCMSAINRIGASDLSNHTHEVHTLQAITRIDGQMTFVPGTMNRIGGKLIFTPGESGVMGDTCVVASKEEPNLKATSIGAVHVEPRAGATPACIDLQAEGSFLRVDELHPRFDPLYHSPKGKKGFAIDMWIWLSDSSQELKIVSQSSEFDGPISDTYLLEMEPAELRTEFDDLEAAKDACRKTANATGVVESHGVLNASEFSRTYSSVWSDDAVGTGHARSMLDSAQGWSAKHNDVNQHMTVDLGAEHEVIGIVLQGGNDDYDQYVERYRAETSTDGVNFQSVEEDFEFEGMKDADQCARVQSDFVSAVKARHVRLRPTSWHGHISMRAAVLVKTSGKFRLGQGTTLYPSSAKQSYIFCGSAQGRYQIVRDCPIQKAPGFDKNLIVGNLSASSETIVVTEMMEDTAVYVRTEDGWQSKPRCLEEHTAFLAKNDSQTEGKIQIREMLHVKLMWLKHSRGWSADRITAKPEDNGSSHDDDGILVLAPVLSFKSIVGMGVGDAQTWCLGIDSKGRAEFRVAKASVKSEAAIPTNTWCHVTATVTRGERIESLTVAVDDHEPTMRHQLQFDEMDGRFRGGEMVEDDEKKLYTLQQAKDRCLQLDDAAGFSFCALRDDPEKHGRCCFHSVTDRGVSGSVFPANDLAQSWDVDGAYAQTWTSHSKQVFAKVPVPKERDTFNMLTIGSASEHVGCKLRSVRLIYDCDLAQKPVERHAQLTSSHEAARVDMRAPERLDLCTFIPRVQPLAYEQQSFGETPIDPLNQRYSQTRHQRQQCHVRCSEIGYDTVTLKFPSRFGNRMEADVPDYCEDASAAQYRILFQAVCDDCHRYHMEQHGTVTWEPDEDCQKKTWNDQSDKSKSRPYIVASVKEKFAKHNCLVCGGKTVAFSRQATEYQCTGGTCDDSTRHTGVRGRCPECKTVWCVECYKFWVPVEMQVFGLLPGQKYEFWVQLCDGTYVSNLGMNQDLYRVEGVDDGLNSSTIPALSTSSPGVLFNPLVVLTVAEPMNVASSFKCFGGQDPIGSIDCFRPPSGQLYQTDAVDQFVAMFGDAPGERLRGRDGFAKYWDLFVGRVALELVDADPSKADIDEDIDEPDWEFGDRQEVPKRRNVERLEQLHAWYCLSCGRSRYFYFTQTVKHGTENPDSFRFCHQCGNFNPEVRDEEGADEANGAAELSNTITSHNRDIMESCDCGRDILRFRRGSQEAGGPVQEIEGWGMRWDEHGIVTAVTPGGSAHSVLRVMQGDQVLTIDRWWVEGTPSDSTKLDELIGMSWTNRRCMFAVAYTSPTRHKPKKHITNSTGVACAALAARAQLLAAPPYEDKNFLLYAILSTLEWSSLQDDHQFSDMPPFPYVQILEHLDVATGTTSHGPLFKFFGIVIKHCLDLAALNKAFQLDGAPLNAPVLDLAASIPISEYCGYWCSHSARYELQHDSETMTVESTEAQSTVESKESNGPAVSIWERSSTVNRQLGKGTILGDILSGNVEGEVCTAMFCGDRLQWSTGVVWYRNKLPTENAMFSQPSMHYTRATLCIGAQEQNLEESCGDRLEEILCLQAELNSFAGQPLDLIAAREVVKTQGDVGMECSSSDEGHTVDTRDTTANAEYATNLRRSKLQIGELEQLMESESSTASRKALKRIQDDIASTNKAPAIVEVHLAKIKELHEMLSSNAASDSLQLLTEILERMYRLEAMLRAQFQHDDNRTCHASSVLAAQIPGCVDSRSEDTSVVKRQALIRAGRIYSPTVRGLLPCILTDDINKLEQVLPHHSLKLFDALAGILCRSIRMTQVRACIGQIHRIQSSLQLLIENQLLRMTQESITSEWSVQMSMARCRESTKNEEIALSGVSGLSRISYPAIEADKALRLAQTRERTNGDWRSVRSSRIDETDMSLRVTIASRLYNLVPSVSVDAATAGVNGYYAFSGEVNGAPCFCNGSSVLFRYQLPDTEQLQDQPRQWYISSLSTITNDDLAQSMQRTAIYKAESTAWLPPSSGWKAISSATLDVSERRLELALVYTDEQPSTTNQLLVNEMLSGLQMGHRLKLAKRGCHSNADELLPDFRLTPRSKDPTEFNVQAELAVLQSITDALAELLSCNRHYNQYPSQSEGTKPLEFLGKDFAQDSPANIGDRTPQPGKSLVVDPRFLVFEFASPFMLREMQVRILTEFIKDANTKMELPEGDTPRGSFVRTSSVKQMIMGAGKTTVIAPLLCVVLANGSQLVTQIVPDALLAMSREVLFVVLSVFGTRVYSLEFERSSAGGSDTAALYHKALAARRTGGVMVTTPNSVKAVMLSYLDKLRKLSKLSPILFLPRKYFAKWGSKDSTNENLKDPTKRMHDIGMWLHQQESEADNLRDLMLLWREGSCLVDEVDLVLHPLRSETNFPIGDKQQVDLGAPRWELAIHLLDAAVAGSKAPYQISVEVKDEHANSILYQIKDKIQEGVKDRDVQSVPHLLLMSPTFYRAKLRNLFGQWVVVYLVHHPTVEAVFKLFKHGSKTWELLVAFVTKQATLPESDLDVVKEVAGLITKHEEQKEANKVHAITVTKLLNLARDWVCSYLPHCLGKRNRVEYGLISAENISAWNSSHSTHADKAAESQRVFKVYGCGMDGFNGHYVVDTAQNGGDFCGKPCYRKNAPGDGEDNDEATVCFCLGKWTFCLDFGKICYSVPSDDNLPPTDGYSKVYFGTSDAPPQLNFHTNSTDNTLPQHETFSDDTLQPKSRKLLAIPFSGKDAPSAKSEFSSPEVLIGLSFLAYRYEGLREYDLYRLHDKVRNEMAGQPGPYVDRPAHRRFSSWLESAASTRQHLDTTVDESEFEILPLDLFDRDDPKQLSTLQRSMAQVGAACVEYVQEMVFPDVLQHQTLKLQASGMDLGSDMLFGTRYGFSGTPSDLIPFSLGSVGVQPGTDARIVRVLTSPQYVTMLKSGVPTEWSAEKILDIVAGSQRFHAMVDAGALITGFSNEDTARYLLDRLPKSFKGCAFLNAENEVMVVMREGGRVVSLRSCGLHPEERFSFYDQIHSTGTDIKQCAQARCAVTLCKGMTLRDLAQAVWRMRGLTIGQTAELIAVPEVERQIIAVRSPGDAAHTDGHLTSSLASLQEAVDEETESTRLRVVIKWLLKNSASSEQKQYLQLLRQQAQNLWRAEAFHKLLQSKAPPLPHSMWDFALKTSAFESHADRTASYLGLRQHKLLELEPHPHSEPEPEPTTEPEPESELEREPEQDPELEPQSSVVSPEALDNVQAPDAVTVDEKVTAKQQELQLFTSRKYVQSPSTVATPGGETAAELLASCDLELYDEALRNKGYVRASDLTMASEKELDELIRDLTLKIPEARRLKNALDMRRLAEIVQTPHTPVGGARQLLAPQQSPVEQQLARMFEQNARIEALLRQQHDPDAPVSALPDPELEHPEVEPEPEPELALKPEAEPETEPVAQPETEIDSSCPRCLELNKSGTLTLLDARDTGVLLSFENPEGFWQNDAFRCHYCFQDIVEGGCRWKCKHVGRVGQSRRAQTRCYSEACGRQPAHGTRGPAVA